MFIDTMTEEEVMNAAYADYKEMRMRILLAYERFRKNLQLKPGQVRAVHSVVETNTFRTKARNTWSVMFVMDSYSNISNTIRTGCIVYIEFPRKTGKDYLFFNFNNQDFRLEWLSAHFLMRYRERYLDYKGINAQGKNIALLYMRGNQDRTQTFYQPLTWTQEDMKDRCFFISAQGLSVLRVVDKAKLLQYITFLDQENLSRYKAIVYEEQQFFKTFMEVKELLRTELRTEDHMLLFNRRTVYNRLREFKNVDKLIDGFTRRLMPAQPEQWEEMRKYCRQVYDILLKDAAELDQNWEKVIKKVTPKTFYDPKVQLSPKELFDNYWAELHKADLQQNG